MAVRVSLLRRQRGEQQQTVAQLAAPGTHIPLLFKVISAIALVYLVAPAIIVVLSAVNAGNYLTFPPQGFSLKWIGKFFSEAYFRDAYIFSFLLALLTALLATTIGTMAAVMLARLRFRGRAVLRSFFITPLMLPGVVLGLALYTFYISLDLPFSRRLSGLLIGHVILTMPFVIGTVSAALYNFDVSLEEAARSLGAGPLKAFRTVTLPIIVSGVLAGFIFAFIISFGAFDISLFLATPDLTPLPIAMYQSLRYQFEPTAAAAGTFAIVLVVVSMLLIAMLTDIRRLAGIKFR